MALTIGWEIVLFGNYGYHAVSEYDSVVGVTLLKLGTYCSGFVFVAFLLGNGVVEIGIKGKLFASDGLDDTAVAGCLDND